jgi:hypothetical protein
MKNLRREGFSGIFWRREFSIGKRRDGRQKV